MTDKVDVAFGPGPTRSSHAVTWAGAGPSAPCGSLALGSWHTPETLAPNGMNEWPFVDFDLLHHAAMSLRLPNTTSYTPNHDTPSSICLVCGPSWPTLQHPQDTPCNDIANEHPNDRHQDPNPDPDPAPGPKSQPPSSPPPATLPGRLSTHSTSKLPPLPTPP